MGKRGALHAQVSMEYLMVVAFVFVIIMPFLVYFLTESNSTSNEIGNAQLSQIARKIVENAEKVYAFGAPTTLTLQVYMPSNIQSAEISGTEITFMMVDGGSLSSVVERFPMNVSGNISVGEGIHRIRLQAVAGYVNISEIT
ncbi:MAG: hypothetical protein V1702_02490 [Candidatus Woesearchaeota archaeon]